MVSLSLTERTEGETTEDVSAGAAERLKTNLPQLPIGQITQNDNIACERPYTFRSEAASSSSSARKDEKPASDNVFVFARFRPQWAMEEQKGGEENCFFDPDGRTVSVSAERGLSTFQFSKVFNTEASQSEVYATVGQPVIHKVMNGINAAIVAYGQTGSGKTHSMIGSFAGAWRDEQDAPDEIEGIIPRTLRDLFFATSNQPTHIDYTISASLVEIYQENITDLLAPATDAKTPLTIREDKQRRLFISNAAQFPVSTAREALGLVQRGLRSRESARTKMNERSSRSHAVVILNIEQRNAVECSLTSSQLYLVDLAGSEVVAKTEASGTVLEEAKSINSSLFALGRVISALAEGRRHVPYRDSKVTRLLQHCFGGSSSTALLINCSASSWNNQETLAALQLGARSQSIVNKVKVNKVHTAAELEKMLREARREIARQAAQLRVQQLELAVLRAEASANPARPRPRPHSDDGNDPADADADESAEEVSEAGGRRRARRDERRTEEGSGSEGGGGGGKAEEEGVVAVAWREERQRGRRVEEEEWCEARFLCPVTRRLMRNPTILADGITYEESVARRYVSGAFAAAPRSPLTGQLLPHPHLTPNTFVRLLIQRCCPVNLDTLPPSVSLTLFPLEPEVELLLLLDCTTLCRLACTCRHFRVAASQDEVWKALLLAERRFNVKGQVLFGELFKTQYQNLFSGRKKPGVDAGARPLGFTGLALQPSR